MATSIKARVDVSVSPYMEITGAGGNQPDITTGLTSATFPTGYFGGGSYLATIDNDNDVEAVACHQTLESNAGSTYTQLKAENDNGVLIIKHSGFTSSAKSTAADAGSSVSVYVRIASTTNYAKVCSLSVANKDVFVIPFTSNGAKQYYVQNDNATASKPAYLEAFLIHSEE
tara:strand:- start:25625 stop:26140 length:516 start_codon:yes stop_codon:yes gene_type:complete